jgi:hypothetical protein
MKKEKSSDKELMEKFTKPYTKKPMNSSQSRKSSVPKMNSKKAFNLLHSERFPFFHNSENNHT